MHLEKLWLSDFRSYRHVELMPVPEGLTVVKGPNGEGKTNLLEAIAYLATLRSLRGSPGEAMIAVGAEEAVVRASIRRQGREMLIESLLRASGRNRVQINRQPLRRSRDLLGALCVTVFAPDDLAMVKGAPLERRQYLDDLLVALHPRHGATQLELERVLKQRNALLKSAAGTSRPGSEVLGTLDVWDAKMAEIGETLVRARRALLEALAPGVDATYGRLSEASSRPGEQGVTMEYQASWTGALSDALALARGDDLRRGTSSVGPQRDEVGIFVGSMPARTHASQGEQRCLALALRLAGHVLVTERIESAPVLLLDDVFSELDPDRAAALVDALPSGQAILTTAGELPPGAVPALVARVEGGKLLT